MTPNSSQFMRILIAALAALIASASSLFAPEILPAAYRDVGLTLLSLYIVIESLMGLRAGEAAPVPVEPRQPPVPAPAAPTEQPLQPGEAMILLSQLQEKGRLVDYLMEDITSYNDGQVAAASRVVHQGCSAVIKEYFDISPVHAGAEGDRITIEKSSDPSLYRLAGKVVGEPPFSGVIVHRGWRTSKVSLPRFTRPVDAATRNVIAPAEVEVR